MCVCMLLMGPIPAASGLGLFPNAPVSLGMFEFNGQHGEVKWDLGGAEGTWISPPCALCLRSNPFIERVLLQRNPTNTS